jgi:hypothetical protein
MRSAAEEAEETEAARPMDSIFCIYCRWDPHPADHGTDDEGHHWVPVEP